MSEHVMKEHHRLQRLKDRSKSAHRILSGPDGQLPAASSELDVTPSRGLLSVRPSGRTDDALVADGVHRMGGPVPSTTQSVVLKPSAAWHDYLASKDVELAAAVLVRGAEVVQGPNPWATIAATRIDPFSSIPFDQSPETTAILHHYAWGMTRVLDLNALGVHYHRFNYLYMIVAVHDPDPLHTILGFATAALARSKHEPEPASATHHRLLAIQKIQRRLETPSDASSNATIGAVSSYAFHEVCILSLTCTTSFRLNMIIVHPIPTGRICSARERPRQIDQASRWY